MIIKQVLFTLIISLFCVTLFSQNIVATDLKKVETKKMISYLYNCNPDHKNNEKSIPILTKKDVTQWNSIAREAMAITRKADTKGIELGFFLEINETGAVENIALLTYKKKGIAVTEEEVLNLMNNMRNKMMFKIQGEPNDLVQLLISCRL